MQMEVELLEHLWKNLVQNGIGYCDCKFGHGHINRSAAVDDPITSLLRFRHLFAQNLQTTSSLERVEIDATELSQYTCEHCAKESRILRRHGRDGFSHHEPSSLPSSLRAESSNHQFS